MSEEIQNILIENMPKFPILYLYAGDIAPESYQDFLSKLKDTQLPLLRTLSLKMEDPIVSAEFIDAIGRQDLSKLHSVSGYPTAALAEFMQGKSIELVKLYKPSEKHQNVERIVKNIIGKSPITDLAIFSPEPALFKQIVDLVPNSLIARLEIMNCPEWLKNPSMLDAAQKLIEKKAVHIPIDGCASAFETLARQKKWSELAKLQNFKDISLFNENLNKTLKRLDLAQITQHLASQDLAPKVYKYLEQNTWYNHQLFKQFVLSHKDDHVQGNLLKALPQGKIKLLLGLVVERSITDVASFSRLSVMYDALSKIMDEYSMLTEKFKLSVTKSCLDQLLQPEFLSKGVVELHSFMKKCVESSIESVSEKIYPSKNLNDIDDIEGTEMCFVEALGGAIAEQKFILSKVDEPVGVEISEQEFILSKVDEPVEVEISEQKFTLSQLKELLEKGQAQEGGSPFAEYYADGCIYSINNDLYYTYNNQMLTNKFMYNCAGEMVGQNPFVESD